MQQLLLVVIVGGDIIFLPPSPSVTICCVARAQALAYFKSMGRSMPESYWKSGTNCCCCLRLLSCARNGSKNPNCVASPFCYCISEDIDSDGIITRNEFSGSKGDRLPDEYHHDGARDL